MNAHTLPQALEAEVSEGAAMALDAASTSDLRARAEAIVAEQQAAFDRAPRNGVCFGGMEREYPRVETVEAVVERLQADVDRFNAFRLTPEGRFVAACWEIVHANNPVGLELLSCSSRGLAGSAAHASRLLSDIPGPAADEARAALSDFLASQVEAV